MPELRDLFKQAGDDHLSVKIKEPEFIAHMMYGWRISKEFHSSNITIICISSGGDFYREATEIEYNIFRELGWKSAIYVLYLSNCRSKLSKLDARINVSIVENESIRTIRKLKSSRQQILRNLNKVKSKLNKNEQNRKISI
tara:strand:+ start:1209 stop:1631 length:423 start_codon:yes stop_codon:yes gene_type:complete